VWWLLGTLLLVVGLVWLGRRLLPERVAAPPGRRATSPPPPGFEAASAIGDELDLHGVDPREVAELVDAFVDEGLRRRLRSLRIVHGKGIGVLRRRVRARLARHPGVRAYRDAPPPSGWGATLVELDVDPSPVAAEPGTD
jgi:dsDNA-specific endonuclease/ATPase MutS2